MKANSKNESRNIKTTTRFEKPSKGFWDIINPDRQSRSNENLWLGPAVKKINILMKETIKFDKVADIYDFYVNVDFDIPFFLKEAELYKGEILELMCGTGRV
jgi:hypothetical protein